jgi:hypothetical protein
MIKWNFRKAMLVKSKNICLLVFQLNVTHNKPTDTLTNANHYKIGAVGAVSMQADRRTLHASEMLALVRHQC